MAVRMMVLMTIHGHKVDCDHGHGQDHGHEHGHHDEHDS